MDLTSRARPARRLDSYQLYRSIDKAHHFMLEMTFLADKASVQGARRRRASSALPSPPHPR